MKSELRRRRYNSALRGCTAVLAVMATGNFAQAQTNTASAPPETVLITASQLVTLPNSQPAPLSTVTTEGINVIGGPAQANIFKTLDLMPSVLEDNADAYGLSFNRSITIRGETDFYLSQTYDGVPVEPTNPFNGTVNSLFDLENIASVDLYRGSLQANQGLGFSDGAGAVDAHILGPKPAFGGMAVQNFGSDDLLHSFVRGDSGELSGGTAFFVSASYTSADKWKGAGGALRTNITAGVSQTFNHVLDIDVYYVHNYQRADNYLPLTYTQVQQLNVNPFPDYNTVLTGKPTVDNQYYAFNQSWETDDVVMADITYHVAPGQTFTLKPYYWGNYTTNLSTSGSGVQLWPIDNYNAGGVAEYDGNFDWGGTLVLGFWGDSMKPPYPPTEEYQFNVTAQDQLSFANWKVAGKFTNHNFESPYGQYTQKFGATTITGGLRLQIEHLPATQYYITAGLPDESYAQLLASNPPVDPNAVVKEVTYSELLPNFGIDQQLDPNWSLDASYARKYGAPAIGPQESTFLSAEKAFVAEGVTITDLLNDIRPELTDEVDLQARYQSGDLTVVPTLFGYKRSNKQVLVYDPSVAEAYYQSDDSTTGYGFELEGVWKLNDQLSFMGNATAQSETYDHNVMTAAGTVVDVAGRQAVYTPQYMLKGAIVYQVDQLTVTPDWRYVSTRQGASDGSQPVAPYFLMDLNLSYDLGTKFGLDLNGPTSLRANFGVFNIFDKRYIGAMSFSEIRLTGTSYYQGAPRTFFGGLSLSF